MRKKPRYIIWGIGGGQILALASSYYLPAVTARQISTELEFPSYIIFGAFSVAIFINGILAPVAGHAIDRHGGRAVLCLSNLVIALCLVLIATAHGVVSVVTGFLIMGVGMGLGTYDAAFAALSAIFGKDARRPISAVALIGGFAISVGWISTILLEDFLGWRGTCFMWAALNIAVGLPIHWMLIPAGAASEVAVARPGVAGGGQARAEPGSDADRRKNMLLLAFVFAVTLTIGTGMAAHLPRILALAGATPEGAILAIAAIGPAQVIVRAAELTLLSRMHPLTMSRLAAALHPIGASAVMLLGGPAALVLTVLHGAGYGMLTIAKGTLPLELFGAQGYGLRTGMLSVPGRFAQSAAPLVLGLLLDALGVQALAVTGALALCSVAALFLIQKPAKTGDVTATDTNGLYPMPEERDLAHSEYRQRAGAGT